jgi:HSP20 family protein
MYPALRNNWSLAPVTTDPINRLDALFNRFFGDDGGFMNQAWSRAAVATWEDENSFYVEADLPGVAQEDLDLTVYNGMLIIRGERKPAAGHAYLYDGRSYGRFERAIVLPEAVQADDVQATLKDGVLSVALPKSPDARPKKITLKTA